MGSDSDFGRIKTTETFGCVTAMEKRRSELQQAGRVVLSKDDPLKGRVGFVGYWPQPKGMEGRWTSADEDAVTVQFFPYGKELRPAGEYHASAEAMEKAFKAHSDHPGFRKYCDPNRMTLGFLCYCTADAGDCFFCTVLLTTCTSLTEDVRRAITPDSVLRLQDRAEGPDSGRT